MSITNSSILTHAETFERKPVTMPSDSGTNYTLTIQWRLLTRNNQSIRWDPCQMNPQSFLPKSPLPLTPSNKPKDLQEHINRAGPFAGASRSGAGQPVPLPTQPPGGLVIPQTWALPCFQTPKVPAPDPSNPWVLVQESTSPYDDLKSKILKDIENFKRDLSDIDQFCYEFFVFLYLSTSASILSLALILCYLIYRRSGLNTTPRPNNVQHM